MVWRNRPLFGGLARAKQGNKYGYLNTKGKVVLPFVYDDADDFNDSKKAMVKYKGKWGMIDNLGNTIIPFEYEQAEPYTKSNWGMGRLLLYPHKRKAER